MSVESHAHGRGPSQLYQCVGELVIAECVLTCAMSRPDNAARAYTIGTTFPSWTLEDDGKTISGVGLVTHSVVVQQWV